MNEDIFELWLAHIEKLKNQTTPQQIGIKLSEVTPAHLNPRLTYLFEPMRYYVTVNNGKSVELQDKDGVVVHRFIESING